ncbi:asparaginase [Paenibacillus lutrae]|uniref:Asparaginase n=1 Tax=Paenibacillus lutrae TaxID=2078573 RepID=A0A7X3FGD7_9BACL|nr:asparaginase [Paenibacillus lutrae]MVO99248.1 asparaginase [Paenibacillus lutrae]
MVQSASASSAVIARVDRGPITESIHRGHIAVVNNEGRLLHSLGDPQAVTFARSTAKLIQALPVLESGAASDFGLSDQEIALICASHNGEPAHVQTARSLLAKAGADPGDLQCGAHFPFHRPTAKRMKEEGEAPTPLHNNCSGKHAGMLTLAAKLGQSADNYMSPDHPVQREMLLAVADMAGLAPEDIPLGTDGCGVPVFGLAIDRLALAYARLGKPYGLPAARTEACGRIIGAIRREPAYLAGEDRFDTQLIEATGGRIIGKMGAEGLFALTVPEESLGLVLKIEDGAQRALYCAVLEALNQLGLLRPSELKALAAFREPKVTNWRGTEVGVIRPDFRLS